MNMVGTVLAASILLGQTSAAPGRFDMGERLKGLDRAWATNPDRARRTLAVPKITAAVMSFFGSKSAEACRALDDASASLMGRAALPEDAITLRFDPPFVEPKMAAKLRVSWAYMPTLNRTVRVQVGRQSFIATPGRDLVIQVKPEQINPEILQNPEVGFLMPVQVGPEQRSVFLSIIKKPRERLNSLRDTKQPEALALAQFLNKAFDEPSVLETDLPLIQYLFTAELFHEGRLKPERADNLPLVKHKETFFRASFPRIVRGGLTVVIALHGAGGSENMFFEAYGRGSAVTEATKRQWAFVAPRSGLNSVADVLDWIKTRRKQRIAKVFVMGHSMGGGIALQSGGVQPRPSAIAVFAPAARTIPASLEGIPLFATVGKQDFLAAGLRSFGQTLASRKDSAYEELDPCEHLMVVGDSIPSAYKFFDSHFGR